VDVGALVLDAVATAVPGVPGGAGTVVHAVRLESQAGKSVVQKTAAGKRVEDFTTKQKNAAKTENAAANGGQMQCADCG
nr:hypothetical protein [Tanacetum cinerariifolium]